MTENAGHCANIDNPLEFNKTVIEFIDETSIVNISDTHRD